jgi:hypothetical protein
MSVPTDPVLVTVAAPLTAVDAEIEVPTEPELLIVTPLNPNDVIDVVTEPALAVAAVPPELGAEVDIALTEP